MPAASSPLAMLCICSRLIWWRLGCMPSRRVVSCSVIFLPCRFMVSSLQGGGNGDGIEAAIKHLLGEQLVGAGTGGGHDVQAAGVRGQEIAQTFHLHEHRDAVAVEHR